MMQLFCETFQDIRVKNICCDDNMTSCFFNCLEELGLIHFNGYVTSERILDMNCEWLKDKNIVIIDDAIVSGTSINRTIEKLNDACVKSIEVSVNSKLLPVDVTSFNINHQAVSN